MNRERGQGFFSKRLISEELIWKELFSVEQISGRLLLAIHTFKRLISKALIWNLLDYVG